MPKQAKLAIILCVLVAAGYIAFAAYKAKNVNQSFSEGINPNLTGEQREEFEKDLASDNQKIEEIEEDYKQDKYIAYLNKAESLYNLGKYNESKDAANVALPLVPDNSDAYYALYMVDVAINDLKGAEEDINNAIRVYPDNFKFWKEYVVFMKDKRGADADKINGIYVDALVKTNNNEELMKDYARFLEEQGNNQSAKEYWQKIAEKDPEHALDYQVKIQRLDQKLNNPQ